MQFYLRLLLLFILSTSIFATASQNANTNRITQVIYVTFDGVRWQDIFLDNHPHFQKFWQKYASSLKIYGAPDSHTVMEAASVPVSLPSYHTQMTGIISPCLDNNCGRITIQTFPETVLYKLNLAKKDVATFASWDSTGLAVESIPGTTFVNEGNIPMSDPVTHKPDLVMKLLNQQQEIDHPPSSDRYDVHTFKQAMHYFEKYKPRLLWISLDDADDSAHDNDLNRYHQALDYYDTALDTLFTTLKRLSLDKTTLVIVTTDHGRGDGANWKSHGVEYPESKQTWAFVMNGELEPISQDNDVTYYNTLSIRPTIENALGVH